VPVHDECQEPLPLLPLTSVCISVSFRVSHLHGRGRITGGTISDTGKAFDSEA